MNTINQIPRECRHIHRHSRESGNPKAIGSKCVFASYRIPGSRFRGDDGNRRLETDILKLTTLPRNLAGNWVSGQWLYLGSTSVARTEHAGSSDRTRGVSGKRTGCIWTMSARTPSTVCWPRCGAGCSGTPTSPSSTAPTMAGDSMPPSLLATALLLQSHDKVSDAEPKARAGLRHPLESSLGD